MNQPVLITHQGETIAVAYDLAGIELAVQEHFVTPDIYLVGVSFMKAEFSDGLTCDLEEVMIYPTTTYNHAFDVAFSQTSSLRQGSIPMKTVQEIFDIVINHGYYKSHFEIRRTSPYMCVALNYATRDGVITESEEHKAYLAIYEYLDPTDCVSLDVALQQSYLPNSFTRRLHLYRNWADRPTLTLGNKQ